MVLVVVWGFFGSDPPLCTDFEMKTKPAMKLKRNLVISPLVAGKALKLSVLWVWDATTELAVVAQQLGH